MSVSRQHTVLNWDKHGTQTRDDHVAMEVPVALTYNKQSHVVMMVTPSELEDFAIGFSLTEGIIESPVDVTAIKVILRRSISAFSEAMGMCFKPGSRIKSQ